MQDPLDYIDYNDLADHGDPGAWKYQGTKPGSGVPAHSPLATPGTLKIYEIYKDEYGEELEVHYFRHLDGTVSNVTVKPRS
jgi:hypothetical protein